MTSATNCFVEDAVTPSATRRYCSLKNGKFKFANIYVYYVLYVYVILYCSQYILENLSLKFSGKNKKNKKQLRVKLMDILLVLKGRFSNKCYRHQFYVNI